MRTILVTGGAGFIGSNFIHHLLQKYDYRVVNLDKLTYAGNLDNLRDIQDDPRYRFVHGNICDSQLVGRVMAEVDAVVHFAAESHVDRSIVDPGAFIQTDVYGTFVLLEAARQRGVERFLHVSTDEVYGQSLPGQRFTEDDPFRPRSPYAASKAGGELQCRAFIETYGLPIVIARPANNIGPRQYPEKAVPLFITNALDDQPLPVYGQGLQVRDRLYVEDHCEALDLLLHWGELGEAYNISADNERPNIEVAETILELLEKPKSLIRFVEDRPGHDQRYSMDSAKMRALGWSPRHDFTAAIEKTVAWYRENRWWWEKVKSGQYQEYYQRMYGRRLAEAKPYEG
ncbi:MAG: dTDP-glucose 4,6-dehydratase [Chloroflexi bacterium RBG_16_68_14]|nr:MAG: dTDP-glucose 4,6-dehydratase [Chloroflexi bacterium RBG_16_68_14]